MLSSNSCFTEFISRKQNIKSLLNYVLLNTITLTPEAKGFQNKWIPQHREAGVFLSILIIMQFFFTPYIPNCRFPIVAKALDILSIGGVAIL